MAWAVRVAQVAVKKTTREDWGGELTDEMKLFLDLHHPHVVACYGIHQMRQVFVATHVPIVNTQIREGYFEDTDVMRQDEGDFTFAVAVSSFTKYDEQSAEDFLQYGQFLMKYKITGGDQDGLEFPISMSPCSDEAMAALLALLGL